MIIKQELFEEFKNTGITGLFSTDKGFRLVKEKFEKQGRLDELEQYIEDLSETAIHQLEEPVGVSAAGEIKFEQPLFYGLLESEGITLDPEDFLRLNGERIAFVDERIIPLKGKRQELKKALKKIVEKRRKLGYADEGPFSYALANVNKLEIYDPTEQLKQRQFHDEYRQAQLELKLLEEAPYIKVQKMKRFGIIPRKIVELNPGYEEFFHNHLGNYSKNEIYFALKKLEKMLSGGNKEKIRALRKEFEKEEGICRSKKLALALGGILAAGAIGYAAYQHFKNNDQHSNNQQNNNGPAEDKTPPTINSVDYKFLPPDGISLSVNATDDSGIAEILVQVQGNNYSLPLANGLYARNITDGMISEIESLPIKIYASDKFGNCAVESLAAVPNLKEKFLSLAIVNGILQPDAENFYASYTDLVQQLFPEDSSSLVSPLKLYSRNSTIFNELHRNISQDPQITVDRDELLSLTSQLFLDLGYTGNVKVLIPETGNYKEDSLNKQTMQAFGNYSVALNQLGLPKHGRDALFLLGNASQINPEIVDFEPVIIKDVDGNIFVIQSNGIARDHWMIAEHLKHTPRVVKYPEMFEGFNVKVQQNAWDILENPHGPGYYDNLTYHADDKVIWDKVIMPQWQYYWNSTPQAGNVSKRITVFPWYNSSLLKEWTPDRTNRTIALIYLWELPGRSFNSTNYTLKSAEALDLYNQGEIDKDMFRELLEEAYKESLLDGIKGTEFFVEQLPRKYEEIMKLYPNGTVYAWGKERDIRAFYYTWLSDRSSHGLENTVKQFLGNLTAQEIWKIVKDNDDFDEIFRTRDNAIHQALDKSWKYWDLTKFIFSYESGKYPTEGDMYIFGLPLVYKAFGIPYGSMSIQPYPLGTGPEWSVSIPKNIATLLESFGEVKLGYGNRLGLYSCIYGLEKDGIEELLEGIRTRSIYLWKKN